MHLSGAAESAAEQWHRPANEGGVVWLVPSRSHHVIQRKNQLLQGSEVNQAHSPHSIPTSMTGLEWRRCSRTWTRSSTLQFGTKHGSMAV